VTAPIDRAPSERAGVEPAGGEPAAGGHAAGAPRDAVASFDRMWAQLGALGRSPETGGYRRFAWTRTDDDLREWFLGECATRGLDVVEDRAGNQWAWWGDPDSTPGVVIGSHLDSVPDGGPFDGPLGVVSALAVVDALRAQGLQPDVPLGVVNFVDEEGARFGVACAGSRIVTGVLDADRARSLTDVDGVTMAQAWRAAGRDPASLGPDPEAVRRIGRFVELHVEQGKALALAPDGSEDLTDPTRSVAIGTDIWPHGRWRVDLPGEANHAGTTRLEDRRDAMLSLADVVHATRSSAVRRGCVATVGKVHVQPGGVNAIASHVTAWLDARGQSAPAVRATVEAVTAEAESLGGTVREESWTPTTDFDAPLVGRLRQVLPDAPLLGTGAGHDAGILASQGVSAAMIFVRNPTGVSHAPDEFATDEDCHHGVAALTAVVTDLCSRKDADAMGDAR